MGSPISPIDGYLSDIEQASATKGEAHPCKPPSSAIVRYHI